MRTVIFRNFADVREQAVDAVTNGTIMLTPEYSVGQYHFAIDDTTYFAVCGPEHYLAIWRHPAMAVGHFLQLVGLFAFADAAWDAGLC